MRKRPALRSKRRPFSRAEPPARARRPCCRRILRVWGPFAREKAPKVAPSLRRPRLAAQDMAEKRRQGTLPGWEAPPADAPFSLVKRGRKTGRSGHSARCGARRGGLPPGPAAFGKSRQKPLVNRRQRSSARKRRPPAARRANPTWRFPGRARAPRRSNRRGSPRCRGSPRAAGRSRPRG